MGYFANEEEGALAYQSALARLKKECPKGTGSAIRIQDQSPDVLQQQQQPTESARRPEAARADTRHTLAQWAHMTAGVQVGGRGNDIERGVMHGYGDGVCGYLPHGLGVSLSPAPHAAPGSMTALFNEHVNPTVFGAEELALRIGRHASQDPREYCFSRAAGFPTPPSSGNPGLGAYAAHGMSMSPSVSVGSRPVTTPLLGGFAAMSPSLYWPL